jgi:UDP-glucose 4-epimerase
VAGGLQKKIENILSKKLREAGKMSKYIVSGGCGFIGSHLTDKLIKDGHEVVVIDDLSSGDLTFLTPHKNLYVVKCDISNWSELLTKTDFFKGVDGMFHMAAKARIQPSIKNPTIYHETNVTGTFNMLQLCRLFDISKIVYSSSSSVYGRNNSPPLKENMPPDCLNPYSVSKYVGEKYVQTWGKIYGVNNVSLRYFNVFGPRQPIFGQYSTVVGLFYHQILKQNKPITIVGDGTQTRDFTYVSDVVSANILAMNSDTTGSLFNIGTGRSISVNELGEKILTSVNSRCGSITIEKRPGEANDTLADNSLAKNVLGWSPSTSLDEGLTIVKNNYLDTWK